MRMPGPASSPGPGGLRSVAEQLRLCGRELFVGEHALVGQGRKLAELVHHRWLSGRGRGCWGRGLLLWRVAAVPALLLRVALLRVALLLLRVAALVLVAAIPLLLLLQAG